MLQQGKLRTRRLHNCNARHLNEQCMFLVFGMCGFDAGPSSPKEFARIGLGRWSFASLSDRKLSQFSQIDSAVLVSQSAPL